MRLVVTGGAGFIGSTWIRRRLARHPNDTLVVLDRLTYAGNPANLAGLSQIHGGYCFLRGDVAAPDDVDGAFDAAGSVDAVLHFAAESHVDRSVEDPAIFVRTNVLGTQVVLEAARRRGAGRVVLVSSDEVYGSLRADDAPLTEAAQLAPSSPYAASKAAAECLARAYVRTYRLPVVVTRGTNTYGPHQFPEKLIPLFITNALEGRPLPLYGDGHQRRDWIHVHDHCDALDAVLDRGRDGEAYNIGARCEIENIEIARILCRAAGLRPEALIQSVADRPGHDFRYAVDPRKLEDELGFRAAIPFAEGIVDTLRWYAQHPGWWRTILRGAHHAPAAAPSYDAAGG